MAKKEKPPAGSSARSSEGMSMPMAGMLFLGILGALVTGASFWVINYWPLPVSVAPYFGFKWGLIFGACAGAFHGLILGFLTDEKHFTPVAQTAAPAGDAKKR